MSKEKSISLDEAKAQFKTFLYAKGLKLTSERDKIIDLVFSMRRHLDVSSLYDEARRRYPEAKLSLATIYRTIPLLEEIGFLKSFHTRGDHKVYECVYGTEHHDHIICLKCGAIVEFTCEEIESYQRKVAKRHRYKLVDHRLELFGICAACDC